MKDRVALPKLLRLEWIDILARDTALPDGAVRTALVISSHFNNRTGSTFLSYAKLALEMNRTSRTTQGAVQILDQSGYLIVDQKHLGFRASDGRRISGGRGNANTYTPAIGKVVLFETARGRKLAENYDLYRRRRSKSPVRKDEETFVPTLPSPSEKDSHPLTERQRGFHGRLEKELGKAIYQSWCRSLVIESIDDQKASLSVEGEFIRSRILRDYTEVIIRCLQADQPNVRSLDVVARASYKG